MESKHKLYLKLNLMSLVFIVVSFISVTLAWFAYSGLADVKTEIGVKAWYIELQKDGQAISNDIVISLSEIYPGMETSHELVNIKNLGDSDAKVNYSIVSARILDDAKDNYKVDGETVKSDYVEDLLSHNYPFHININLSKNYILSKGTDSSFEVSVSWPLDSDDNAFDSLWGTGAYKFQQSEISKKTADSNYQIRPSIQVVIKITAEQYLKDDETSDSRYNLGDLVLYDVVNNHACSEISSTCISTYVIDVNNKIGDTTVTLLPNPKDTYLSGSYDNYASLFSSETSSWTAPTRTLLADDILKVVSTDVMNSNLIRSGISNSIIGNLKYPNRISTELLKATSYNGYYNFLNSKFGYLSSANCYWTSNSYNDTHGFAVKKVDETNTKVFGEEKTASCNVIPVIIAPKTNLE